ncbi:O-antigen ligase family protein [Ramlibacter sp. AN1133]|uniref:O-antigen ligase family protein n=1 Tax=Ramlibacter sp. AN1133 TaxID=3133429 RepID=UPI0030C01E71
MTGLLLCCAPLFVLTLRGWANAVLFVGALLAMLLLASRGLPRAALAREDRRWAAALVLAYLAPLLSVAVAAALRHDADITQFDAPSRFLLAIPVFLFVLRSGWPAGSLLQWVLPAALAVVLGYLQIVGQDPYWPSVRVTTHVVDPLVFGYFNLAFGLMCFASITPADWREGRRWGILLRLAATGLGLYFSLLSWSRTGWLALPVVVGLWLYHHWGRTHRLAAAGALAAALLLPVLAYFAVPVVQLRVDEAFTQLSQYPWHGGVERRETSAGYRITYLRIAADMFAMNPWAGVGLTAHAAPYPANAFAYAAPDAVAAAFASGFHNQIVTNAIRSGLGGLLATAALLFVPLLLCLRGLRGAAPGEGRQALIGVAYCTCLVVSSLSTEVVDLKFAASFYATMTAILCGAVLGERRQAAALSAR